MRRHPRPGTARPGRARRVTSTGVIALGLAASLVPPAPGQEQPPARGAVFAEEVSVGYVLVPVSVHSRRGFVTDLAAEDFRLFVDGRPVEPESFEAGVEALLELVLLQDLSGSMALGGKLEASRSTVSCFLDGLRPGDRYALASFAGRRLTVEVPYTDDRTAGRQAMARWQPYGVTALHDAVARLPEIKAAGRTARAALLITDGAENASTLDAATAREVVRTASLPVYVLSLTAERSRDADASTYESLLRQLAGATGGRYLPITSPERLGAACDTVMAELRARYVLGFPTAELGEARWRGLKVEVARRRVSIRSRSGYYGPPPADSGDRSVR